MCGPLAFAAVQVALFVVPLAIMFVHSHLTTRNYRVVPERTPADYRGFFES